MNPTIVRTNALRFALPAALIALAACASGNQSAATPQPAEISNEVTATADVVAVSTPSRTVTLRREDGAQLDVVCGDEVRNFSQIKVGDKLRVAYRETLAASMSSAEEFNLAQGEVVAGRAKEGERPGAGVGARISIRVRVESIDRDRGIVTYALPTGEMSARKVQTPEGREFIKNLKVGDIVKLDYTQVLALSVEKV